MDILDILHRPLIQMIEAIEPSSHCMPDSLNCDSYVARSAMQKAIRRGLPKLALRAAVTVIQTDPKIAWRRLLVTLLEDVGTHQSELLVRTAAAFERRRFGLADDVDWPLLSQLISSACRSMKCQAANDLHNVSINDTEYHEARKSLAAAAVDDIVGVAADDARSLVDRNIAVLTCLGRVHAPWQTGKQLIARDILISSISTGVGEEARLLYDWAFQKSGLALATSSILLRSVDTGPTVSDTIVGDCIPASEHIGAVPSFALDQYTRIGRAAIRDFVREDPDWQAYAKEVGLTKSCQIQAAGEMVFRVESAVVDQRRDWPWGRNLAERSRPVGCFVPINSVERGLGVIQSKLPVLNLMRERRYREALND
jgi:hypothetical protein